MVNDERVSGFDSKCDSDSLIFVECEVVDVAVYPRLFVFFTVFCPRSLQLWFCDDVKTHHKRLFLNSAINPAAEPAPLKPQKTQQQVRARLHNQG
jgi:hypothetical protein